MSLNAFCTTRVFLTCSRLLKSALFDEPTIGAGLGGLVLMRDIDYACLDANSLLPFYGRAHIAFVPSSCTVPGLSKLARLAKLVARTLQSPQSLASRLASELDRALQPAGALVVVTARSLVPGGPPQSALTYAAAAVGCLALSSSSSSSGAPCLEEALALMDLADQLPPSAIVTLMSQSPQPAAALCSDSSSSEAHAVSLHDITGRRRVTVEVPGRPSSPRGPDTPGCCSDTSADEDDLSDAQGNITSEQLKHSSSCCPPSTEDMEAAMLSLLLDAGVDAHSTSQLQAAARQYVLGLVQSTAGYSAPLPSRAPDGTLVLLPPAAAAAAAASACCSHDGAPITTTTTTTTATCCLAGAPTQQEQQQKKQQQQTVCGSYRRGNRIHHHYSVPFASQCEHHVLPFHGMAHIEYVTPAQDGEEGSRRCCHTAPPLPMDAVEQVVAAYSQRLQLQERINQQIADELAALLGMQQKKHDESVNGMMHNSGSSSSSGADGVMVVVEAVHMCVVSRGVENHSGSTRTRVALGAYAQDAELRCAFLDMLRSSGAASGQQGQESTGGSAHVCVQAVAGQ
jgi:GTP cyclohydrolase IA